MNNKPTFEQIQLFVKSYGLAPIRETYTHCGGSKTSYSGITEMNGMCFGRMKVEATKLFGKTFSDFLVNETYNNNGIYYMITTDWAQLKENWEGFIK